MVNFTLVLTLILLFPVSAASGAVDRVYTEGYLGEKDLETYADRYQPLIYQDLYRGKMTFLDELHFQDFFRPYLFAPELDYGFFLKSELTGGLLCSNELLSQHFDDIRYSYRLITLSYLLEGQWHLKLASDHFGFRAGCGFDLKRWLGECKPRSPEMKKFVEGLSTILPRYEEKLPLEYKKQDWLKEFTAGNFTQYSHYRLKPLCRGSSCSESNIAERFRRACESDRRLMTLICSEEDDLYGLSNNRDAYFLLGLSNVINTYNKRGEAPGCLRRFSEVMAHREARYPVLNFLFPSLQTFLREKHQERFLQGRVFFLGSAKEFEEKGLRDLHVKAQPLKLEKFPAEEAAEVATAPAKPLVKVAANPVVVAQPEDAKQAMIKEIQAPLKSAFLQAAEIRLGSGLDRVEVDMLKLKYDYVFSLNMINSLSERLKTFMTLEALQEMTAYDKLGTREGPVPLLFLKYMIDMEEHHGLWNIISVMGDRFYVSNEIDAPFKPAPELVQLLNNETTGRQWQLFILRP